MSPWRSLLVSAAGPVTGIFIGTSALLLMDALHIPAASLARYAFRSLIFVNLGWGLLNLLPVLPLDGGNIVASLMELAVPSRGRLLACYVSFAAIGLLLAVTVTLEQYPATILLFLLAFSTYQAFRIERHKLALSAQQPLAPRGAQPQEPAPPPQTLLQHAFQALERGDGQALIRLASQLVSQAHSTEEQDEAFHLLAWGRLMNGEPLEAQQALHSLSGERAADPALEGAVLVELGRPADAVPLLKEACKRGGDFARSYYQRALREITA